MGDPLSITASLIAILQTTSVAVGFLQGVRHAPKDIKDFMNELDSLKSCFTSLRDYASANPDSTMLQKYDPRLRECLDDMRKLKAKLEPKDPFRKVAFWLRWALKDGEYLKYLDKIERLKSDILMAMGVEQGSRSKVIAIRAERIEDGVEKITVGREQDSALRQDEKRMKVLNWLNPTAYDERHHEVRNRRQSNTGDWLLKEEVVVDWAGGNLATQVLLGYGIPGAGKTFLCSRMIDHLSNLAIAEKWGVAYLYFNHSEQNQQTPIFFLSSIVKQFACQLVHLPGEVNELYEQLHPKQARPTPEQLYILLVAVTKLFTQTFIICDALDECEQYAQRTKLLPLFNQMGKDGMRLFLTSREYPEDIQLALQSAAKIRLLAQDDDIRVYIERKIAENRRAESLIKQTGCKEKIISMLQTCANGMFLLVHFHVRYLCEQTTQRQLLNALETLKNSSSEGSPLDPTYNRAMEIIRSQPRSCVELAFKVLTWLVKSRQVLTLRELQQAVSVEKDQTNFDELALPSEKTMIDVCASLVSIDQESNIVRLVHYTVKEYLVNNDIIPEDADFRLMMACATFLSYKDFSSGPCNSFESMEARYEMYPFMRYAGMHFVFHLQQCDEALSFDLVLRFLKDKKNMLSYLQADDESGYFGDDLEQMESVQDYSLVSLAATLGHTSVIRSLLKRGLDISGKGIFGRTALTIAVELRYSSMVEVLLENGAGVSDTDEWGATPLHSAVALGDEKIVRILLGKGANIMFEDEEGLTPLHLVLNGENEKVAKILLEKVAVSATDNKQTPLHIAASVGNQEAVSFLLEKGALISVMDKEGRTPLHIAASHGGQEVAKVLIEKGADVSATDNQGQTPLHIAASRSSLEIVKILLEKDANISVMDKAGRTPLHTAASYSSQEVVKTLLENGADISATDNQGQTPLHLAVPRSSQEVARILLEKGADVSVTDKVGRTPLHIAASHGSQEAVKILTEKGANILATDDEGQTLLHLAASRLGLEEVRILLASGADVSVTDKAGRTPLHTAAFHSSPEVVKILTENGADISATDNQGQTPLHLAVSRWSQEVTRILLEDGADVSVTDKEGRTPLHIAASHSSQEVVQILLGGGADISVTDNKGQTPLHIAASRWNQEVARILLGSGADVSATDAKGRTPLHIAASQRSLEAVEILLIHRACISARDNKGQTPLHIAASHSSQEVVQILFENGANASVTDKEGQTPLHIAASQEVTRILLRKGTDISVTDKEGQTPLHIAASRKNSVEARCF